jgi:hypothetical protein
MDHRRRQTSVGVDQSRVETGRETGCLLAIDNLPAHVWLPVVVQTIISSSYLSFEIAPASLNKEDLSRFFVVAWAIHPNLIPVKVGCVEPEPEEEQVVGVRPLFLPFGQTRLSI